jgi:sporulation protein YlmC with PRC-barrel domain
MNWIAIALVFVVSAPVMVARAAERATWREGGGHVASTALIGASVRNTAGENVGRLDALLVDPRTGKVSSAVVALAPLPTLTQQRVVVPWTDIRIQVEQESIRKAPPHPTVVARVEQAALDRAPRYER